MCLPRRRTTWRSVRRGKLGEISRYGDEHPQGRREQCTTRRDTKDSSVRTPHTHPSPSDTCQTWRAGAPRSRKTEQETYRSTANYLLYWALRETIAVFTVSALNLVTLVVLLSSCGDDFSTTFRRFGTRPFLSGWVKSSPANFEFREKYPNKPKENETSYFNAVTPDLLFNRF